MEKRDEFMLSADAMFYTKTSYKSIVKWENETKKLNDREIGKLIEKWNRIWKMRENMSIISTCNYFILFSSKTKDIFITNNGVTW